MKQYPNLEFVVPDQASGLRKDVNDCGREITHQYDVFHFKREIGRWLRGQEARCYELIEQVEQARQLIDAPRLLSSARMQARGEYREKAAALDKRPLAFDWVELIVNYLYESLTAYDARRREIRTRAGAEAMIEEVLDLLKEVDQINTKPLISMIEGSRAGLLTFLTEMEEKLQRIEVRWRYVTGCRRAAFNAVARAWHHSAQAHQSRRRQRSYLAASGTGAAGSRTLAKWSGRSVRRSIKW